MYKLTSTSYSASVGVATFQYQMLRPPLPWSPLIFTLLPPALVEEVIFLVVSTCVCLCVCVCVSVHLFALCRLNRWTDGHKIWHRLRWPSYLEQVRRSRSKVKVTKVENIKTSAFSLVSENVVQGQGHEGQGQRLQASRSKVKIKGRGSRSWIKVVGPRSKLLGGVLYPIDSHEVRHAGVLIKLGNFTQDLMPFLTFYHNYWRNLPCC